ncbi:MAG: C-terminal binding protein [Candidatus Latescibacteria bacterium]|nr:C-terminal binding protein [Candidatus Latescibacterota bacterium]
MSDKILFKISDYIEPDLKWEEEQCKQLGVDFKYYQMKTATPAELIENCADADILLVNMAKVTPEVMAGLKNVKVLIRHGIGYDNFDLPSATENGIVCANQPTASSEDVAEQAIMLMMATYRKIFIQKDILSKSVANGKWMFESVYPVYRIGGKTLGIIGCGNIGSYVLKKMRSFGMKILVDDPYLSKERLKELGIEHTQLEKVLKEADIVTIHVPVTDETRGMFNARTFKLMKNSAILINTARGPMINVPDLAEALKNGIIAGAGIDVYDKEPPDPDYPLLGMEKAVLTPHLAWYSVEGGWDIRYTVIDDLKAFVAGKLPKSVINPSVLSSPKLKMKFK